MCIFDVERGWDEICDQTENRIPNKCVDKIYSTFLCPETL